MNDFDEILEFFAGFKVKKRFFVEEIKVMIGNYCLWEDGRLLFGEL